MSGTLHLIDRLLDIGRKYQRVHRPRAALRCFGRLAALPDLTPTAAAEIHSRLAELYLHRKRFRKARRHIGIALLYQPDCARYHRLQGVALAKGRDADLGRAIDAYQQALELDADQPRWLAQLGILCMKHGEVEEGLGALMRAVQMAPDDPKLLAVLAKALCRQRRSQEAERVLRAARFRHSRDSRFQGLWQQFRFRQLRAEQRRARRNADSAWRTADGGPLLLKFTAAAAPVELPPNTRQDEAQPLRGPLRRQSVRRPGWKHG